VSDPEDRIEKLEAGATRRKEEQAKQANKETPSRERLKRANRDLARQLERTNQRLARQEEENAVLRARLARRAAGEELEGVRPENIVWVLGSGRTGSSWLSSMMRTLPDHARWNEPNVGKLFGRFYYERTLQGKEHKDNFILASGFRETWLGSIRRVVLDGANARFPELAESGGYLVIKEPHGSLGAPLLMEALPESRMVFLVREPKDVVASALHVSFVRETASTPRWQEAEEFVRTRAKDYLRDVNHTKQAYEVHEGRKVLVRYEDLKADTLGTIKRIYTALEISVEERELARAVKKGALENIPEDKKGPGTVRRRGTSGGWREDLTPQQVEIVERITVPLLKEFYA
jgi:sulfotransferase family protein